MARREKGQCASAMQCRICPDCLAVAAGGKAFLNEINFSNKKIQVKYKYRNSNKRKSYF